MNDNYDIPVRGSHMSDDYELPIIDSDLDREYSTIATVMDTKIKPKEIPSGYTKTKNVIIIFVITIVVSMCFCGAIYFISSTNCSCKRQNAASDVTNHVSADNATTNATGDCPVTFCIPCTQQTTYTHHIMSTPKVCTNVWTRYKESCYLFGHECSMTFNEAKSFCDQQSNAVVVQLETTEENEFVKDYLRRVQAVSAWTGLTDTTIEDDWRWYGTNTTASFFDWGPDQPNSNAGQEDCVMLNSGINHTWSDFPCQDKFRVICEISMSG